MYNNQRKQEFLQYIKEVNYNPVVNCEFTFDHISNLERNMNKDVCECNEEEAEEILKALKTTTRSSLQTYVYLFRKYCDWCLNNSITTNPNPFNNFTKNVIEELLDEKNKQVALTEEEIEKYCDELCPTAIDKVIFRGLYEGFSKEELVLLKKDDFIIKENIIVCSKGKIRISSHLAEYILESFKEESITREARYSTVSIPLEDNDYIVRFPVELRESRVSYDNIRLQKITRRLVHRLRNHPHLTPLLFYYSGLINSIVDICKNQDVTIYDIGFMQIPEVQDVLIRYGKPNMQAYRLRKIFRNYNYKL